MAHIDSLGTATFSSLSYVATTTRPATPAAWFTLQGVADANMNPIGNVREFPSLGTPANIVNVPVYGQSTSSQVSGQSDAPTLTYTLNYVPADHKELEALRVAGTTIAVRNRLAASAADAVGGSELLKFDDIWFFAKVAAFEITPSLSDAMQASVTFAIAGDFAGPYTLEGGNTANEYVA